MATATEDRESPVAEMMEDIPFSDLEDTPTNLAPETPLTREAVIHLRAAAAEVSDGYAEVSAQVATVRRRLAQLDDIAHAGSGPGIRLSEEEALELAQLLRTAEKGMVADMMEPVFERGRGERPHADGPHLSLDEEELRDLALQLSVISFLGVVDMADSDHLRRRVLGRISLMADNLVKQLEERAGLPDLLEDLADEASARRDEIKEEAREKVDGGPETGEAGPEEDDPYLTSADRLFDVLNVCRSSIQLAADGELENATDVSPRQVMRKVADFLEPAWSDCLDARGADREEMCDKGLATVQSLAGEVKEERS